MERTMQLSNKRHQVSNEGQNVGSIDRLSGLPDAVICHILSFLPTKNSVKTSILARRWRFLWAHVPNLEFYHSYNSSDTSLSSIVNRVMLRHKLQSINTFTFFANDSDCSEYDLETWVITAIKRNFQKLDITFKSGSLMLPHCLFNCKTLVDLRLTSCDFPALSGAVFLPNLKKLLLRDVEYVVEEALPRLLSGCPVLEELTIDVLRKLKMGFLNISSPTIKRLTVDFGFPFFGVVFDNDLDVRLTINAPALTYLQMWAVSCEQVSFSGAVTSLREADVLLNTYVMGTDHDSCTRSVWKFFESLCNVKFLQFECKKDRDLAVPGSIVKFHNLTKLEFAADWRLLSYFLGNADNLQALIIISVVDDQQCWLEPFQVPTCQLSHLRTVTIECMCDTEHEFGVIRYLLRNAKALERMEIHYRCVGILKPKFDSLKRISSFKRGSEECELIFI